MIQLQHVQGSPRSPKMPPPKNGPDLLAMVTVDQVPREQWSHEDIAAMDRIAKKAQEIKRLRSISPHPKINQMTSDITLDSVILLAQRVKALSKEASFYDLESRLVEAHKVGVAPSAYSIDPGDNNNTDAMERVATKSWADQVE